ncbi:MAG TPA: class I SAM-dependent methyltransferase [Mycobacteriales bacterium]
MDPLDATRTSYDAVAETYAELFGDELAGKPLDRAVLAAFAETVSGPVADLGCGPGHVTAHLHGLGCQAFGVDLSAAMVAVARRAYPAVSFSQGDMTQLDITSGSLGGIVAFYSIIHLPPELLPVALAEFARVLAPAGQVMLAFQTAPALPRLAPTTVRRPHRHPAHRDDEPPARRVARRPAASPTPSWQPLPAPCTACIPPAYLRA